jgi:uncharacterized protein DUF669
MMTQENGTQGIDYLSLDGLVTDETRAWSGETAGLPVGDYRVRVAEVEKKPSSNNNPQLTVQFEVTEGEHKGRKARCWYTLTEKAIGRLMNLLQSVGMKLDGKKGFSPQALIGQELVIGVFEDKVEGDPNPMTGARDTKTFSKVYNERPLKEWETIKAKAAQPRA